MPSLAEVVDMSAAQSAAADFSKAISAIVGAWFKATDGVALSASGTDNIDSHFFTFAANSKKSGLPFGAYHYFHVRAGRGIDGQDGRAQADQFCDAYLKSGATLPPMVDVESAMNTVDMQGNKLPNQPTTDEWRAGLRQFVTRVYERLGRYPLIYTSPGEWGSFGLTTATEFLVCELWVADTRGRQSPEVPGPWTTWRLWQYTWSAQVPGIEGNVDKSRFAGTPDGFAAWAGQSGSVAGKAVTIGILGGVAYALYKLWQFLGK